MPVHGLTNVQTIERRKHLNRHAMVSTGERVSSRAVRLKRPLTVNQVGRDVLVAPFARGGGARRPALPMMRYKDKTEANR